MMHFCTYCDQGYAARLLCLHASLRSHGERFRLYVLCFDPETEAVVSAIRDPSFVAIPLYEVMGADPEYAASRSNRSLVEFYFTSTPVLVKYCLLRDPSALQMTYLDSDLLFFAPPSNAFAVQGNASVGIVAHRFPARLNHLLRCGAYNVAWVSFRRTSNGLDCLEWWRKQCLAWCHDFVDQGRYADQGYLDEFPKRFREVTELNHAGINAAPWNLDDVRIQAKDNGVYIDDERLIFFHFQGIREVMPGWFDPGLRTYGTSLSKPLRDLVYLPYLEKLAEIQQQLREQFGIQPQFGYKRLTSGHALRDRWQRFAVQRLLPIYRRARGQLIHCSEPTVPPARIPPTCAAP